MGRTGLRMGRIPRPCTIWSTSSLPVARNMCSTGSVNLPASNVPCVRQPKISHQGFLHISISFFYMGIFFSQNQRFCATTPDFPSRLFPHRYPFLFSPRNKEFFPGKNRYFQHLGLVFCKRIFMPSEENHS